MRTGNGLTNAVGDFRHHYTLASCDGNQVDGIATIVSLLHEGQRQDDPRTTFATEVHALTHIVVDTHYLIVDIVDADALATRVSAARKQLFIGLLLDDTHLAVIADVSLIDVSAIEHFRFVDTLEVGHGTADTNGRFTVTIVG